MLESTYIAYRVGVRKKHAEPVLADSVHTYLVR